MQKEKAGLNLYIFIERSTCHWRLEKIFRYSHQLLRTGTRFNLTLQSHSPNKSIIEYNIVTVSDVLFYPLKNLFPGTASPINLMEWRFSQVLTINSFSLQSPVKGWELAGLEPVIFFNKIN